MHRCANPGLNRPFGSIQSPNFEPDIGQVHKSSGSNQGPELNCGSTSQGEKTYYVSSVGGYLYLASIQVLNQLSLLLLPLSLPMPSQLLRRSMRTILRLRLMGRMGSSIVMQ